MIFIFNRFDECLLAALQPQEEKCSLQEDMDKKPVYRRRRKRIQDSSESDCDRQSVNEQNESYREETDWNLTLLS